MSKNIIIGGKEYDGVKLYKTHSSAGKIIRKTGTEEEYTEAIDVENAPYTYWETEKDIPKEHVET